MDRTIKVLLSVGQLDATRTKINPIGMRVARGVPVLIDYDEKDPLGYCSCIIDDDKIYALVPITEEFYQQIFLDRDNEFWNLYPSFSLGILHSRKHTDHMEITDFEILEVSFNTVEGPEKKVTNMRQQFNLQLSTLIE